MSGKIKVLPQALSNKIAAGEVVNRPESVVKELMENSIDSGADKIIVIIKDAGKSLVQVIDNGSGMPEEDAAMCFLRHSTSKVATYEDLESIRTLGFRGEALASIASVSQVELKTRTIEEEIATLIRIDGGEEVERSKVASDIGTSISVKNLFFNTPGRRNFLKSNQTEFRHIYDTFIRLSLANPGNAFELINNDDTIFDLRKSSLRERILEIFGKGFSEALVEVEHENEKIRVFGYISKPNFTKKTRQDQFLYLNNRYFTNKNLNFAVYSGYDDLIEKGDYPSFFLFIEIDPKKVDVNVHPSKMEVKFDDESMAFGTIRKSVKESLKKADLVFNVGFSNTLSLGGDSESFSFAPPSRESRETPATRHERFSHDFPQRTGVNIHSILDAGQYQPQKQEKPEPYTPVQSNVFEHTKKSEYEGFNVWQFQLKYIMCQTETGFMIIDQHAAHERILYERALLWMESHSSFSQQLLIPVRSTLSKIDFHIAKELKDEIMNLGFGLNFIGDDIVEITGVPSDVRLGNENKILLELIEQYKEYELKLNLEKRDNLAKSFSCRSAIKSGDKLTPGEMTNLIDDLFACTMPYVCPHGRPTVIRITTDELDKRFSRT